MKYLLPKKVVAGLVTTLLLLGQEAYAQLDSCNAFLKGNYIEVGISTNGAYGSSVAAPSGFHPKGGTSIGNTCYPNNCVPFGENVGFVADPAKDGWTVGTPPYFGDYFLPGTPQEGWSIQVDDSLRMDAWNQNSYCSSTVDPFAYAGTPRISGFSNISCDTTGTKRKTVWQGTWDSLQITQTTILDTSTVFFTVYMEVANMSTTRKRNIYYLRTVDPDNDEPEPGGGFTTINKIEYQLPNSKGATLVSATGQSSSLAFLGLGTLDCRAKCFYINTGLSPQTGVSSAHGLDAMYKAGSDVSSYYTYTGSNTQDQGIGLVFSLDSLDPGQCTSFAYAYILRKADLDQAFASTVPRWTDFGDTASYITGDTAIVCKNSTVTLTIVNGGCYRWNWTSLSGNYMSSTSGNTVNVSLDTTAARFMAIGNNGSCIADTLYMTVIPQISVTPVVRPVHYCVGTTPTPLTAEVDSSVTLVWYNSDPSDTGRLTPPTPSTDSVGVFMYYVSGRYKGCLSNKVPIAVTVDSAPPPLIVGSNAPLCLHEDLHLTANTITPSVYTWTGPNGFSSSLQNPTINDVQAADSGLYTLSDTMEGCPRQTVTINVLVDNVFSKISADKEATCIGDTLHLNFGGHVPDTNSTIKWDFANGTILSGDPTGQSSGPYVVQWDTMGKKYVTVTAQNWRCISTVIDTIPVEYAPDVMFSMPKDICVDDTVKAQIAPYSMTNANAIAWDFGDGQQIDLGGERSNGYVKFNTTGQKIISLTLSYPQCIRQPYTDTVMVHDLPNAHIQPIDDKNICQGDVVTFTADAYPQYKYMWSPEQFFRMEPNGTLQSGTIHGTLQFSSMIYVTVHDQYNCAATDSVYLNANECCKVSFPDAFTPNGDGKNDVFKPVTVGNHPVKIFRIVNRYGQTVFESNDEKRGWDGKLNGVPQDVGTYYYYLNYECNGKTIEEKGSVILLR